MSNHRAAIVLLSGGLDSATCLALARQQGFDVYALSFSYGQRHSVELEASRRVAHALGATAHRIANIDLAAFGGSALTDLSIDVPVAAPNAPVDHSEEIPITYVPARNTIFLSYALAWAEVLESDDIFIGVNAVDYSGYPDCRLEFINAFETMANLATRRAVEGAKLHIHAPLMKMSKAQIIEVGVSLGVDYGATISCYQADDQGAACGACDSCRLRREGFLQAGVPDPTLYQG
ncbi:ExsB protein [gamma proteobacterium HdN1]|nr:ExsB protein [gamma proteobacterium HdN1]